ncbi:BPSS1780 family membrane protein [Chitinilyticum litopenaei]|uniref:BPSS1780 family membrane protein n=1 Tax=Chitinilyticum litopenaei TaxID=1121276 RepID=UPI0003F60F2E|nr:BPSS1780 family membrane protein [Chitinilyticum litopenaei]
MSQHDPSFNNPYAASQVSLEQHRELDSNFIPDGQHVGAGSATRWFGLGWDMFKQAPGPWVLITITYFAIMLLLGVVSMIPILGMFTSLIQYLGMPVLLGGIFLGCHALDQGDELTVGHLFAGFQDKLGQLIVIGALFLGLIIALGILVAIIVFVGIGTAGLGGMMGGDDAAMLTALAGMGGIFIILMLIFVPLILLVSMVFYIAPALVVLQGLSGLDALKSAWRGWTKNLGALLVYMLLSILLAIVAMIPCGLGFLIAIPMYFIALYAAYRDIFLAY